MTKLYENIRKRRKELHLTQDELALKVGYVGKSMVSRIEKGEVDLSQSKIQAFADALHMTVADLTGETEHLPRYANIAPLRTKRYPVLGEIACGGPIYMSEERDMYVEASSDIRADFVLYARGDSMINARIQDGDVVFIRKQPVVENGQIAAVAIDDEATLKRVYFTDNTVTLIAENPKYAPLVFGKEFNDRVRILGKAIAFQSEIV